LFRNRPPAGRRINPAACYYVYMTNNATPAKAVKPRDAKAKPSKVKAKKATAEKADQVAPIVESVDSEWL